MISKSTMESQEWNFLHILFCMAMICSLPDQLLDAMLVPQSDLHLQTWPSSIEARCAAVHSLQFRLLHFRLEDCKVVVSTDKSLLVLSLPSLKTVYTHQCSNALMSDTYIDQLIIHYLYGDITAPPCLSYISQVSPEARYTMMINKQQYEVALAFAKKHNLDTQVVATPRILLVSYSVPCQLTLCVS